MIVTTRNNRLHSHRAQVRDSAFIIQTLFGVRKKSHKLFVLLDICIDKQSRSAYNARRISVWKLAEEMRFFSLFSKQRWMTHLLTTMMEMVKTYGKCILPINSNCNGIYEKCKKLSLFNNNSYRFLFFIFLCWIDEIFHFIVAFLPWALQKQKINRNTMTSMKNETTTFWGDK